MILFDTPRPAGYARFKRTAHMMAVGGHDDLVAFARSIGLRDSWIQNAGTETEHYDLFDGKIDEARKAGAIEVTGIELIERIVRPRRAARKAAEASP